jgi:hypothetical protein
MLRCVRGTDAARALRALLSDAPTLHSPVHSLHNATLSGACDAVDSSLSRLLRGALHADTPVRGALLRSCAAGAPARAAATATVTLRASEV